MSFPNFNTLLITSERKILSLYQLEAGLLQAMLPQKGETKTRVRFKGFKDEYSSMKASELFKTFDERNYPELPVLSACQDIRGMAPRSESGYDIFHDQSNEVTYKRVLPGQFVIHLRSFQGGFAHSPLKVFVLLHIQCSVSRKTVNTMAIIGSTSLCLKLSLIV